MIDILSTKEVIFHATLGIPKGMKNAVFIFIPASAKSLIRIEKVASEELKTRNL